jgi:hypothetical protein
MVLEVSYGTWKLIVKNPDRPPLTPYLMPNDTGSPIACAVSGVGPDAVMYQSTLTASELADFNSAFPGAGEIVAPTDVLAAYVAGIDVPTFAPARFTVSMGFIDVNPLTVPLTMVTAVWIPADVTAVRVRMNNNDQTGAVGDGPNVTGVGLAIGASNGLYGYDGTPNVISAGGITVPGSGAADYVTGWQPVMRGADGKMLVVFSIPSGQWIKTNSGGANLYNGRRSQTVAQVDPLPTLVDSGSTAFTVRVECQRTSVPRFVVIGDSLPLGYGIPGLPGLECAYGYLLGPNKGWAVDIAAVPGATNADWNNPARPFSTGMMLGGAIAVSDLSINDLPLVSNAADLLARISTRSSQMKAAGAKRFVQMTLAQNAAYPAQDAIRLVVNSALVAGGVAGVDLAVDVATLIAALPSPLLPDGTHWTQATHAAVSSLLAGQLQSIL